MGFTKCGDKMQTVKHNFVPRKFCGEKESRVRGVYVKRKSLGRSLGKEMEIGAGAFQEGVAHGKPSGTLEKTREGQWGWTELQRGGWGRVQTGSLGSTDSVGYILSSGELMVSPEKIFLTTRMAIQGPIV